MSISPPPEGRKPADVRERPRGMWLVIAVVAATIVVVMAFSFNRSEVPPDVPAPDATTTTPEATLPVDPATEPADDPVTEPAPEDGVPETAP